jgi:hypothetical protein
MSKSVCGYQRQTSNDGAHRVAHDEQALVLQALQRGGAVEATVATVVPHPRAPGVPWHGCAVHQPYGRLRRGLASVQRPSRQPSPLIIISPLDGWWVEAQSAA